MQLFHSPSHPCLWNSLPLDLLPSASSQLLILCSQFFSTEIFPHSLPPPLSLSLFYSLPTSPLLPYLLLILNPLLPHLPQAFLSRVHPLGQLLQALADAFRASYGGVAAHPRLLSYAVQEVCC